MIYHFYNIQKIFCLDNITNGNRVRHYLKWPYITDHSYRMLITGGSGSRKTNALLDLIKEQGNNKLIDKIYLYDKESNETKYQFLIKNLKMQE